MLRLNTFASAGRRVLPNQWDLIAFAAILAVLTAIARSYHGISAPLPAPNESPVSLDYWQLPYYALRTTLRMFAALAASLVFTFTYATLAAKSRRAEMVLIPVLDILQSVPILGFLSFTVTFFLGLFPGNTLGAELAAIFAIFTSQAWNMAFSFYQSLRTVPRDLDEVARGFRLTGWQKFWQLEAPFAMPGLIWNTMMSMSGGWFFVVASEAITVGDTTITLPGVGSYIAKANDEGNWSAIGAAVLTMGDRHPALRSAAVPADRRLGGQVPGRTVGQPGRRSVVGAQPAQAHALAAPGVTSGLRRAARRQPPAAALPAPSRRREAARTTSLRALIDALWIVVIVAVAAWAAWLTISYIATELSWDEVVQVFVLTFYTLIRVVVLMALATVVWVPISVWIGLRPRWAEAVQPIAQFLAAFPVNLLFGAAVSLVLAFNLNPNIWLSLLIVFGTQWYIVFNTIGGAAAFPNDLREAAANFRIRGWRWWTQVILPGVAPYYLTGAITASGGSWNASIVAEYVKWKDHTVVAAGRRLLYRRGDRQGRLSEDRARRRDDVDLRHAVQPAVLAPALRLRRAAPAPLNAPLHRGVSPCWTQPSTTLLNVDNVSQIFSTGSGESRAPVLERRLA